MATHGFSVLTQGDVARVVPNAEAKAEAGGGPTGGDLLETRVIQVQHTPATELIPLIRPLVPQYGHLAAVPSANALIISDRSANIARIQDLIRSLDRAESGNYTVVTLQHGWAVDIADVLRNTTARGEGQGAGLQNTQIIADSRTNRLIFIGPAGARNQLADLARSLDTTSTRSANTRVIRLRHNDAKQLAEVLGEVSEGLAPAPGQTDTQTLRTQQPILIRADESLNALVLLADPELIGTLESIVRQLDVPRAQVMVEAAIVEISGDITDALGVQWAVDARGGTAAWAASASATPALHRHGARGLPGGRDSRRPAGRRGHRHRHPQLRRADHRALGQQQQQPAVHPEPADPGQPAGGNPRRPERALPDRLLHHRCRRRQQPLHHHRAAGCRRDPQGGAAHQRGRDPAPGNRAGNLLDRPDRRRGRRPDHQQALAQEHHPRRRRPGDRARRPDPGRHHPHQLQGAAARRHPPARRPLPLDPGHPCQAQPDDLPAPDRGARSRRHRRPVRPQVQRHPPGEHRLGPARRAAGKCQHAVRRPGRAAGSGPAPRRCRTRAATAAADTPRAVPGPGWRTANHAADPAHAVVPGPAHGLVAGQRLGIQLASLDSLDSATGLQQRLRTQATTPTCSPPRDATGSSSARSPSAPRPAACASSCSSSTSSTASW